ncbi:MAG: response regulator transcription factor [Saprospiraceae bacterium]|nr:LytTR family DNA-binding domain-containing protein [Bacteroidia bacterium]NNE15330.1 response regulator transcription factor [Saprospiraceae bacterium]NNL90728.1 response regulator transcription factor [Saprospiraceae bacterium]
MKLTAIIIDDEPQCREVLSKELEAFNDKIELIKVCSGGKEGILAINALKPDVVFLDIEMPHLDGFDVLNMVKEESFAVIFTTSHDEYAIKAIRSSAFDYLLKPIQSEELSSSISNLLNQKEFKNKKKIDFLKEQIQNLNEGGINKIALSTLKGVTFVSIDTILYCESDNAYTNIFTNDGKKYVISKNLSYYESILPTNIFFRCHKSYIVNTDHIENLVKSDGGYVIMKDGKSIGIARSRKKEFYHFLHVNA